MWDSENSFDYLGVLSESGSLLVQKTCQNFNLPKKGLILLFDISDYEDLQNDSLWRNLGNHLNIEFGDGISSDPPPKLDKIIKSKDYSHLIWLAKRAWATAAIDFVWNLSHELRHLEQDIENHYLSLAGIFLYFNLSGMEIDEPKIQTTVPTEMDAELTAWKTTQRVFGKQIADSYVGNNANSGKKKEIFRDLIKHGSNKEYDVISEVIKLLLKYKTQFDDIIDQAPSYYRELVSVDELCKKLTNP